MKIESYEMSMSSKHFFSLEYEKEISFSSMLEYPQESKVDLISQQERPSDFSIAGQLRLIDQIIQNLMSMLQEKVQNTRQVASVNHRIMERESLSFSTVGHIKTNKGCMDINLNFNMSREFVVQNRIDLFDSFDPLVINLDGSLPKLSQDTFNFDLDNDGECDQISKLGSGSGFLALDKNNDGIINQGSELFGTITGNGFDELSQYDSDMNSWIDENDKIFDKLRIWLKNEESNEKELVGLGEVGIGAIYLGSEKSEFKYKNSFNQMLGEMRSCGVFLKEDGSCGNISQIDFVAQKNHEDKNKEQKKPLEMLLQV